jgi:hypothetical protein
MVLAHEIGCGTGDCRSGSDDCIVRSPCDALRFECSGRGFTRVRVIESFDELPGGLDALGAVGHILLENDRVQVVIDAIDQPHYVAASGGAILDLATQRGDDDSINHVFQATGLLPADAARYVSMELIQEDALSAVVFRGHLDGKADQRIATRYELRPCEPGVRVRTEFVNLDVEDAIVFLADGWYWSGREALPFTPIPGIGFEHPSFGLLDVQDVFFRVPLMAASAHTEPAAAYSVTACSDPFLEGFQSDQISALGTERRIVPPRGTEVFERFIAVASGRSVGPAVDLALEVRRQLFEEEHVRISGRVVAEDRRPLEPDEVRANVMIWDGDTPLTQVLPDRDGEYSASVPAGRTHRIEVSAFGRVMVVRDIGTSTDAGEIEIPAASRVVLHVELDGRAEETQIFFHPGDDETRSAVTGKLLGAFVPCAPLLGAPFGGSPACNRVLVRGTERVELPAGRYDIYATAGLFASLAHRRIDIAAGETATVSLSLVSLPLRPRGSLSADMHVHGGVSHDSSIPDRDRVRAFLAAGVDVVVATDHDVVHDYADARMELGAQRPIVITGLETTAHVLFDLVPDSTIPLAIGHYNFWPLMVRRDAPRRGAPYDELIEPGRLFTRMEDEGGLPSSGVRQLNHPWADPEFGRDLGFPRALGFDLNEPLPRERGDDGPSLFLSTPPNSRYANSDYHVQEVMNGTNNESFAAYRAIWFYLLNQGVIRGGTANSDSHTLVDNVLGTPRTLVFAETTTSAFDQATFDEAVKAGRMIGTNGPVIEASIGGVAPSIDPIADEGSLDLRVTAAPWVPVEELRIVVNGEVVQTLPLEPPGMGNPFGTEGLVRFEGSIPLDELLPSEGPAWLVVEAGAPLLTNADLDCDGVPDTGDNDGNGVIDWRDVDREDDDVLDEKDLDVDGDGEVDGDDEPEPCETAVGPLASAPKPARDDPRRHFEAVTPGGYPLAFTNPFVFDRGGR